MTAMLSKKRDLYIDIADRYEKKADIVVIGLTLMLSFISSMI